MEPLLLLNPPARLPTMRDYYCSSTSKAGYLWQPMDLICQSGYLSKHFDLHLIDAPVQGWNENRTLAAIEDLHPKAIFSLVGSAGGTDDFGFLESVVKRTGANLYVSGDLPRFYPEQVCRKYPFVKGVVMDFTSPDLLGHLLGQDEPFSGLHLNGQASDALPKAHGEFTYPIPRHDLFTGQRYRMSFLGRPFASILTNYGCPFRCKYCNSGEIGFSGRIADNLFEEMEFIRSLGIRYLFVKDFTFNASIRHAKMILKHWLKRDFRFHWIGYLRAENIDPELAELLKKTKCSMAQIGIETSDEGVLNNLKSVVNPASAKAGMQVLASSGVPYGGHFILGLPGDGEEGFEEIINLACELKLGYASFNVFTERPGSKLAGDDWGTASGGMDPSLAKVGTPSDQQLARWLRKAYIRFYLRPGYLLMLFRYIRTPRVFASLLMMGLSFLQSKSGGIK